MTVDVILERYAAEDSIHLQRLACWRCQRTIGLGVVVFVRLAEGREFVSTLCESCADKLTLAPTIYHILEES
jgi:RNase P subunit RPR2